jgi:hypothetical protein
MIADILPVALFSSSRGTIVKTGVKLFSDFFV